MKFSFGVKTIVVLVVIGATMAFTLWAFSSSMTPYVDIATARQSAATVQVRGKILHETVVYDGARGALMFTIQDDKGARIDVVYRGGKPEAFDTAPETAAHGQVRDGKFYSDSMVVKCPSKYDERKNPYKKDAKTGGPV